MKKINIIGDIFGMTGYALHTRFLANALHEIGFDVRIETQKNPQWERYVNDFELNAITKKFDNDCTTIMIGQPQSWPIGLAKKSKHFYGFLVWEGDKIPSDWINYISDERIDGIFVPSTHVKKAVLKSCKYKHIMRDYTPAAPVITMDAGLFLKNKIHIVSHGYDPTKIFPLNIKHKKFSFIANKGWSQGMSDRGGIQFAIKAFANEFSKKENVCLKIKINTSYNPPGWNLEAELKKLNLPKNRPMIYTVTSMLNDKAMNKFYNDGDIFISTSMAEGFNLPCLEAMGCNLCVIATNFGGQTDFVNKNNGYLLTKGKLGHYSKEISYEDVYWKKPNISEIQKTMRHCFTHQKEVKMKAEKAFVTASRLTWRQTAKTIKKLIC